MQIPIIFLRLGLLKFELFLYISRYVCSTVFQTDIFCQKCNIYINKKVLSVHFFGIFYSVFAYFHYYQSDNARVVFTMYAEGGFINLCVLIIRWKR